MKHKRHLVKTGSIVVAASAIFAGAIASNGGLSTVFGKDQPLLGATASGPVVGATASGPVVGATASGPSDNTGSTTPVYTSPSTTVVVSGTVSSNSASTLTSSDGSVTIDFPAGTFSSDTKVNVSLKKDEDLSVPKPNGLQTVGPIISITAGDLEHIKLGQPVTIKLKYNAQQIAKLDPHRIAVFYQDENSGEWLYMGASVNSQDGTISFTTNHFSTYAVLANTREFQDAASLGWAAQAVQSALGGNIVEGFSDGTFKPADSVTRAQFVQMLVRSLGLSSSDKAAGVSFKDVAPGAWYYNSVAVGVKAGLVSGISDSAFAPDAPVTREQAAALINRAFALKAVSSVNLTFKDINSVSPWAKGAVEKLVNAGVLSGYEDQTARPQVQVSRAQAAKLLVGALENVGKASFK